MKTFNLVDVNSEEFKSVVLGIVQSSCPKLKTSTRFVTLPDGYVRDLTTGLDWGKSSSEYMNLSKAKDFCVKNGGRLPTMKELQSLVDYTKHDPAIDKDFFPDTKSAWYWTSDITAWDKVAVWCVSFNGGNVSYDDEGFNSDVRPVRSSQ